MLSSILSNLLKVIAFYNIVTQLKRWLLSTPSKIQTSALGSLTAAMEEDTNQTSRQPRKCVFFIYEKCTSARKALWVTLAL